MKHDPNRVDETVYLTYSGEIDDVTVSRFMSALDYGVTHGLKTVHLLLQSIGGVIPAGFALHNYLKRLPVALNTYDGGSMRRVPHDLYHRMWDLVIFLEDNLPKLPQLPKWRAPKLPKPTQSRPRKASKSQ